MENLGIDRLADIVAYRKWEKMDIKAVVDKIERNMQEASGAPVTLTHLQKTVLNDPNFWGAWEAERFTGKDLIIQGATSAGKTLLSEISILDCLSQNKKALVLVPLKALVHERYKQFVRDFAVRDEDSYKIYASSSDYLDMDPRLIKGDYDVGILVYEKLFAMLCQDTCNILQNCGLIVVDELSMLSKDERGPKLEIALEKVKTSAAAPRIVCLTTTDNEVDRIREWLSITHRTCADAEEAAPADTVAVIADPYRPVGLDEYIVTYDGRYKMRRLPGENDPFQEEQTADGRFEVPDNRTARDSVRRMDLLTEILRTLYQQKPDMKTLLFVPSQAGATALAQSLAERLPGVFPRKALEESMDMPADNETAENLLEELKHCDPDEDLQINRDRLLPFGIAYHHSSMSTTLREVIEGYFRRSSHAKVIVATETLTIGVNMPFDTVIITDHLIPRGQDEKRPITNQEYRNYIGRAGRLGMSERGQSYLLLPSNELRTKYWDDLYRSKEQITSALTSVNAETVTPYFLNLLAGRGSFREEDVDSMYRSSLAYICSRKSRFDAGKITALLQRYALAKKERQTYKLSDVGKTLVAYAFNLDTTDSLEYFFVGPYEEETALEYGAGIPADITAEDIIKDRYLLDILYCICEDAEVKNSSLLRLPSLANARYSVAEIRSKVFTALYTLLEDEEQQRLGVRDFQRSEQAPPERCRLWHESAIEKNFFSRQLPEWEKTQQLFRAIVMFYWTKGRSANQIKKCIDLSGYRVRCSSGDMERFAEVVSYHLDAVSHLIVYNSAPEMQAKLSQIGKALYNLSNRNKYGLQADAVIIANRHVHGLDRGRILQLRREAHEKHNTDTLTYLRRAPVQDIEKWVTRQQRLKLLRLLQDRYTEGGLEAQIKNMEGNFVLGDDFCRALRTIHGYNDIDPRPFFEEMQYVLGNSPDDCLIPCSSLTGTGVPCARRWNYNTATGVSTIYIAYLYAGGENAGTEEQKRAQQEQLAQIRQFFDRDECRGKARILISGGNSTELLRKAAEEAQVRFTLGITGENMAALLLSAISWGADAVSSTAPDPAADGSIVSLGGAELLFDVLQDARGVPVTLRFSSTNYTPEDYNGEPAYQILMDQDAAEGSASQLLCSSLLADAELKQFRLLPWGKALDDNKYTHLPTVIKLTRAQIQSSHSLTKFMYRMGEGRFENCMVLAENQEDWTEPVKLTNALPWRDVNCRCAVRRGRNVAEMKKEIQQFIGMERRPETFLIGISYAHFDGTDPADRAAWRSDVDVLKRLVERLNRRYGEQRILFDGNHTCTEQGLFYGDHSKAQSAYQQCLLVLVLDNEWTRDNANCSNEYEWVQDQVKAGRSEMWLLQTASSRNPEKAKDAYTNLLPADDAGLDRLAEDIAAYIRTHSRENRPAVGKAEIV